MNAGHGVEEMLRRRFPEVAIVKGGAELAKAFDECDLLLHGSGPSLVAQKDVARWHEKTGKPFGVCGITLPDPNEATIGVLNEAKFVFFRDSVSLQAAKDKGCRAPVMAFGPDGAFAADVRDDAKAEAFLAAHGLEEGKFLCCIPRYRHTPYWRIPEKKRARDEAKAARNDEMKEHDHAPLRAAIEAVVRQTDHKVMLCPEDMTQMRIGKEMLYDPLPAAAKKRVVWREGYWLTDEAISTYVRSAGIFGNEMHSPIMGIGNGVPAIVCRFAEQTSKGIMWRDIGLGDWLFDHDKDEPAQKLTPAALALASDHAAAKEKALAARDRVRALQKAMIAEVANHLPR
ncbi:MAG: polysaccharide pyruvyl transferase family protein [Verrucomicrobiales bacterium]